MNVIQNDFTAGIINPALFGKYNSLAFNNGCLAMDNFSIIPQGGVTKRPGTTLKNTPDHTQVPARTMTGKRLIPFGIRKDINFLLEIGNGTIRAWTQNAEALLTFHVSGSDYTTLTAAQTGFALYTEEEAKDIQYSQDYEHLYLAHRNHPPVVVTYSTESQGGTIVPKLTFSQLTPVLQSNDTDNRGLFTGDDCPGVVLYYASRLWFASSNNHPYRIWASRPFKYSNFEFWDIEEVVNDGVTAETIESAVKYGIVTLTSDIAASVDEDIWDALSLASGTYVFIYDDGWKLSGETVSLSEYGIAVDGEPETGSRISVRYFNINEITYASENVYREDSALLLEVGSNRNDQILWMNSMGNYIVVGTSSGEWLMNGAINGLSQSIYQASAYGSEPVQAVQAGNDLIFVQSGGFKTRAYVGSSDGFACPDLNFNSGFLSGVRRVAWQRVPEPRLYCLTEDNKLMVLFYDRQYSLLGWSQWTFGGTSHEGETETDTVAKIHDVCVSESGDGQTLYLLIERGSGTGENYTSRLNLESLDMIDYENPDLFMADCKTFAEDGGLSGYCVYSCNLLTRLYDTAISGKGSTLGNQKRIYRAVARVMASPQITIGYQYVMKRDLDDRYMQTRKAANDFMDDIEITIPGGFEKFISIGITGNDTRPLTILALSMLTEVS